MRIFAAIFCLLIGGIACAGTLTVNWTNPTLNTDGSALTDLASINVYRATSAAGPFAKIASVVPAAGAAVPTSYADTTAKAGTVEYYYVTAVNSASMESAPSATASGKVPETPNAPTNLVIKWGGG